MFAWQFAVNTRGRTQLETSPPNQMSNDTPAREPKPNGQSPGTKSQQPAGRIQDKELKNPAQLAVSGRRKCRFTLRAD
jgi:hypothetical protein